MAEPTILIALILAAGATYVWRAVGVFAAGRIRVDGPVFAWITYVAYGLLSALVARMIVMPVGSLHTIPLSVRIGCAGAGLAVFFIGRRTVAGGVAAGAGLLGLYAWLAG